MMFSISFLDIPTEYPYDDASTKAARGRIVLGNFAEEFLANLHEWTQPEYREHWNRSILSMLEGEKNAVLIMSFNLPAVASHLEWWALYRVEERIFVQNQLILFDDLKSEFDVNRAVESLRDHRLQTDEGVRISEWSVSMDDLRTFVAHGPLVV
jgi:hypothetical protein